MLIFMIQTFLLCLCIRIVLLLENNAEMFRGKGNEVRNIFSNGIKKIYELKLYFKNVCIYMHIWKENLKNE